MTKLLRNNVVLLRAGQNANRVLHVDLCEITPVSEETGRWSRMDSNPFARSIFLYSSQPSRNPYKSRVSCAKGAACVGKLRLVNCLKSPSRLQAEESVEIIPIQTESGVENRIGVAMKLLRPFASLLVPLVLVGCRTISG
jgi:hypothetical protein